MAKVSHLAGNEQHSNLDFGFKLFQGMQKDNLGYIYRGMFTQTITDSIISLAETNLETTGESPKVKKRVFSILVECLQNITRHQTEHGDEIKDTDNSGIFVIQKQENSYYITTGNVVQHTAIPKLSSQLEKINSFDPDELKEYYKKILEDGTLSDKGGAGLGLIEMARKSGNKLSYEFAKINDVYSYFYLHAAISKEVDSTPVVIDLENIKNLHQIVNEEEILLVFNGVLNQDSLLSLLSIIEGQIAHDVDMRKRVYSLIVEMLQNIVKHAIKYKENETTIGNPGIFFISSKNDYYTLSTGNYIETIIVDELKSKLDHVNSLVGDELDLFYTKRLLNFEIDNSKEAGLGIIDLRMKSGNKLEYNFYKIDDKVSFFTLQIKI